MGIMYDAQNLVSNGGTELMLRGLESRIDPELLSQVIISRSMDVLESAPTNTPRIFWAHEVPATTESDPKEFNHLMNKRWQAFDRMVCVSNWQMLEYTRAFHFGWADWSKTRVMQNAIVPIEPHDKPKDKIRLIYTSSPQRGLSLLYTAFNALAKKYPELELEVFSSFKLYKNPSENDNSFAELFQKLEEHPQIVYHGAATNMEVREALKRSHIFAYPCVWGETSCLSLIEAMSAGLLCVHPNNAALFETAANWTNMYHYEAEPNAHLFTLLAQLDGAIQQYKDGRTEHLKLQSEYAAYAHGWDRRAKQWEEFLRSLL